MTESLAYRLRHRPRLAVALAISAAALLPGTAVAAPRDTVIVTGGADRFYTNVSISAQSGPAGQNPSGTVSFTFAGMFAITAPVTSLTVTGADSGAGARTASTVAVIGVQTAQFGPQMIKLIDNGGNGLDAICMWPASNPDCTTEIGGEFLDVTGQLTSGRAVVFDAPVLPSTRTQCKNGGWRGFSQFTDQRQCVEFVIQQARTGCLAERAAIGRAAFRWKYAEGSDRRDALRRCVASVAG